MAIEAIEPLLSARWESRDPRVLAMSLFVSPSGRIRLDVSVMGPGYSVPVSPEADQEQRCAKCGTSGKHACARRDRLTKSVFLLAVEDGSRIDEALALAVKMADCTATDADHAEIDTLTHDGSDLAVVWSRP